MRKQCTRCGETKPPGAECKTCHNAHERAVRASKTAADPEWRNREMAAYRAGMRKDKCALCAAPTVGGGVCGACWSHVRALGGLEGLKRAVRAVRYLEGQ